MAEIMDVTPSAIEQEVFKHDVQILIHGHTHRPAVHSLELAGFRHYRVVLGDWFDQESYLEIRNGEISFSPGKQTRYIDLRTFSRSNSEATSGFTQRD